MPETLATVSRAQLAAVFKDPRTLLAFEAMQRQVTEVLPDAFAALQNAPFLIANSSPETPAASLLMAGGGISLTGSPGALTVALTDTPVMPGAYSYGSFTVDVKGRLTAAASNAHTGTGSVVLSDSPTLTGTTTAATVDAQTLLKGKGTATNDNAAAGYIGEFIEAYVPPGSAVALTSGVTTNIASIALTAGDWEVYGSVATSPAATTLTSSAYAAISTVSATLPALNAGAINVNYLPAVSGLAVTVPSGQCRISISAPATVYLVTFVTFTTSTNAAFGYIGARRER